MVSEQDRHAVARGCRGYEALLEKNWCGNVHFHGSPTVPVTIEAVQDLVRTAAPPIRIVGRGHSFTPMAECAGGTLVSLARLNRVLDFRPPTPDRIGAITIEGGTTYTEVAKFLGKRGALRNLPSCPQFTVAGAIATATHGSGVHIQNLAADVAMIEFVVADGSIKRYDQERSAELLQGSRVHLGCLGIVSALTLDVVPYFEVASYRYDDVPLAAAIDSLPELWRTCDSLSVWTSGFGHGPGAGLCWMTFRHFSPHWAPALAVSRHTPPSLGGGALLQRPIPRYCGDPDSPPTFTATNSLPWYDALTLTLHEGEETSMETVDLQAEFFVPLQHAQAALRAVWEAAREWSFSSPWGFQGDPVEGLVNAMEFRQVKGDGAWLSPQHVDSLGIHVSFNGDPAWREEVLKQLPTLEKALAPFGARAHWGKLAPLTTLPARVVELYGERLHRFRALCKEHDPTGKFRNVHVSEMLFGELLVSARL